MGDGLQPVEIVLADSASGHDLYPALRAAYQLCYEFRTLRCRVAMAGGEQTVAAQEDDLLEGFERCTAHIEGAVESDGHGPGGSNQGAHQRHVHGAIGEQSANHHTGNAERLAQMYGPEHLIGLAVAIDEIPFPGADKHIHGNVTTHFHQSFLKQLTRRGDPTHVESLAQFYPVGTAAQSVDHILDGAATTFYYSSHQCKNTIKFVHLDGHTHPIMSRKALLSAIAALFCIYAAAQPYSECYESLPIPLEMPSLPVIPEFSVELTDFGAAGDGVTLCTDAFAKAVDELSIKGGGHLNVPAGVWLTGPIRLRSRIDLHLDKGALVIFTPDKRAYLPEGNNGQRALPCILAEKCTDISITGEGILDGNGKYWRYAKDSKYSKVEWGDLLRLGGTVTEDGLWFPSGLKHFEDITESPQKEEGLRAHMVNISRCSRVLISGVTVQNAPRFHIVPNQCTDVVMDGVTVRCPWNAQNGDGIDIGNSRRVLVTGCTLDVGDDGICMKGGSGETGLKKGPCSDILICGNTVFHAHGGFVMGSDVSGGMKKIVVRDCTFSGTDVGLRFKSAVGRGGECGDIYISGIRMNDIRESAVGFECSYSDITYKLEAAPGEGVSFAPDFCGIHISALVCRECRTGIRAEGIEGLDCIHDVTISDATFFYTEAATRIDGKTASITMDGCRFLTFNR